MSYGICLLSVVPARKEPSGASEMVTQLLFGECYTVIENTGDWLKIITSHDHYECWISAKQHSRLSDNTYKLQQKEKKVYAGDLVQVLHDTKQNTSFPLTIGATLPFINKNKLAFDENEFDFEGHQVEENNKGTADDIISTALLFLNAPYLWGGRSPFGIDCSGFSQLVYKLNGFKLPRDAYQQVEKGFPLSFADEAEKGDLAYFDNEEGRITHVGILMGQNQIIHASGKVRIDKFDHYGIFNVDTKKYSHHLRVIKRVL